MPPRIGRYQVMERLAEGGMAEVYKVKSLGVAGFEKVLALKRMLPKLASDPRFIQSFIDEARIAVELTHRNIVQVYDFGRADGELYLAMELVDGVDLRRVLADARISGRPIPSALVCYLVGEIAGGLDHAHRRRDRDGRPLAIVHCDISPSNAMVSREGYVKILDFGVARANFSSALKQRRLRGKPRYMAPEQTRGDVPSPASDVFALGVVAWELAAGRSLFRGSDLRDTIRRVRAAEAPDLAGLRPDLPPAVTAAIHRALRQSPVDRCNAAELALVCGPHAARPRAMAAWLSDLSNDALAPLPPPERTETHLGERIPRLGDYEDAVTRADPAYRPDQEDLVVELAQENDLLPAPALRDDTAVQPAAPPASTADASGRFRFEPARHRGVVMAVVLVSPPSRSFADELVSRALQRGAVVWEHDDSRVDLAFGLDVPGDDNVENALAWSLAESRMPGPIGTRIGCLLGVEVARGAWPAHERDRVEALAEHAAVGQPSVHGDASDLAHASALGYELAPAVDNSWALVDRQAATCGSLDDGVVDEQARIAIGEALARDVPLLVIHGELQRITATLANVLYANGTAALTFVAPPQNQAQPFGLLASIGERTGGPLRDVVTRLRAEPVAAAEHADAWIEQLATDLETLFWPPGSPTRPVIIQNADTADRASLRVLFRAWNRNPHARGPLLLVGRGIPILPSGQAFEMPDPEFVAVASGDPAAVLSSAELSVGALELATLLHSNGGELRRAILAELGSEVEIADALAELVGGGFVEATTTHVVRLVAGFALPINGDLVRSAQRGFAAILQTRDQAGRPESLVRIAELLESLRDNASGVAWQAAGDNALAAGDADGAQRAYSHAAKTADTSHQRLALLGRDRARNLLDYRLRRADDDVRGETLDLATIDGLSTEPGPKLAFALHRLERAWLRERYAEVIASARHVVPLALDRGDELAAARAHLRWGQAAILLGDLTQAATVLSSAHRTFVRHGAVEQEVFCGLAIALRLGHAGELAAAATTLEGLSPLALHLRSPVLLRRLLEAQAVVELARGNVSIALRQASRALRQPALEDIASVGGPAVVAAEILLAVGERDQARVQLAQALASPTMHVARYARAWADAARARCEDDPMARRAMLTSVIGVADALEAPLLQASLRWLRDDDAPTSTAVSELDRALELAISASATRLAINVRISLAAALLEAGSRDHAERHLYAALAEFERTAPTDVGVPAFLRRCADVAAATGDPSLHHALKARARQRLRAVMIDLSEPGWRASYAAMPHHRDLLTS